MQVALIYPVICVNHQKLGLDSLVGWSLGTAGLPPSVVHHCIPEQFILLHEVLPKVELKSPSCNFSSFVLVLSEEP